MIQNKIDVLRLEHETMFNELSIVLEHFTTYVNDLNKTTQAIIDAQEDKERYETGIVHGIKLASSVKLVSMLQKFLSKNKANFKNVNKEYDKFTTKLGWNQELLNRFNGIAGRTESK